MQSNGDALYVTAAFGAACTTGFDANEALQATRHKCVKCGKEAKSYSQVILMEVIQGGHECWCFQRYSKFGKGDEKDDRAWCDPCGRATTRVVRI